MKFENMKLLAIESAGLVASVAIATEETVLAEYTTDFKKTHSQTLLPMIDEICKMTETKPETFDAIAVSKGPGSFTGLRIGAATAKGMGLALDKPLIPVSTLASMACNFVGYDKLIVPIMDARRDQVYTGIYSFKQEYETLFCASCGQLPKEDLNASGGINRFSWKLVNVMEDGPKSISELLDTLNAIGEDVIFLGDGVPRFGQTIEDLAVFPFTFAPAHLNRQKASSLAMLAFQEYKRGQTVTAAEFAPDYFRPSQAEREREGK